MKLPVALPLVGVVALIGACSWFPSAGPGQVIEGDGVLEDGHAQHCMAIAIAGTTYWIERWPADLSADAANTVVRDDQGSVVLHTGDRVHVKGRVWPLGGDHGCLDTSGFFVVDEFRLDGSP